ncbi:MAG: HAD-IC family P-type ATPase, partial [Clostridia bacterium]|nr:HAD-IC family P-type ATPase [Clostridia bacterium]
LPFSSARKYSAVSFTGQGTFFLGALEFVLNGINEQLQETISKHTSKGLRVLVLAHSATTATSQDKLPAVRRAIALIVIEDKIRKDAADTIKWFKGNGVQVKVISGDNASTVSKIASRVGVENADKYVSLEGMTEEQVKQAATKYTVFGRVTPDQKAILVKALKASGKTVAMTGDGVNDILAMKESDCAIGLASGSDAARNVAHLIMQDDSFASLPHVVNEGRRVVNNIQSSTTLYFMKTVYVIVVNFIIALMHFAFDVTLTTPYETIQIFVLETVIVGITATVLALQPNTQIIKGKFFHNVISKCLPASLTFLVTTASLYFVKNFVMTDMTGDQLNTLIALTYTVGGYYALFYACKPFNGWKIALYAGVGVVSILLITLMPAAWKYVELTREQILLLLVEVFASWSILRGFMYLFSLKGKNKKTN